MGVVGVKGEICISDFQTDPLPDFELAWKKFLVEFQQWAMQSPAQNTSGLNVKLTFFRCY